MTGLAEAAVTAADGPRPQDLLADGAQQPCGSPEQATPSEPPAPPPPAPAPAPAATPLPATPATPPRGSAGGGGGGARTAAARDLVSGKPGAWQFNSIVAERFDREASCHIPDYHEVIALSVETVASLATSQLPLAEIGMVDVGCATGNTLHTFLAHGFRRVSGVDCSDDMLDKARAKLPASVALYNSMTFPAGRFHAVVANWTLHFIQDLDARAAYLAAIFHGLLDGGVLVLTEKTLHDTLVESMYHNWKRRQGVSEDEIKAKKNKIKGVLVNVSAGWYHTALAEAGFTDVAVVSARFGFVTWIARKPAGPTAEVAQAGAGVGVGGES